MTNFDAFRWEPYDHPKYRFRLTALYVVYVPELNIPGMYITDDGFVQLSKGWLSLAKGYAWDGASFPAINCKTNRRGSCLHDGPYQLHREAGLPMRYRKRSDAVFRRVCIEDGMHPTRAWADYWGLRAFGMLAARPKG